MRTNQHGELDTFDPFNYSHPYSDGWDGDTLVAYRNDAGEAAYVWKLAFDSERDAREFLTGYRRVLQYNGGQADTGRPNVWVISEGQSFSDAFYIHQRGPTVLVVNAPEIDQLETVRTTIETNGNDPTGATETGPR